MFLIFILALFLHLSPLPHLLNENASVFTDFIFHMQNFCVSQIPEKSDFKDLSAAFLCGKNIEDPWRKEIFQKTGLIHLLVVSGGHFAFLVACLDFFSFPLKHFHLLRTLFLWFVFIAFSFLTGFQAPVVRALGTLVFKKLSEHFLWHWDSGKTQLAAGVTILALYPEWLYSLSFYLSWLASLSLCFPLLWQDHTRSAQHSWRKKFLTWISTCLCVQGAVGLFFWSFSFLGVAMNCLVAPLMMLTLWPLSLGIVVFPSLSHLSDFLWQWLLKGLDYLSQGFSSPDIQLTNLPWLYLWSVIIGFHLLVEILRRFRFQNSYV